MSEMTLIQLRCKGLPSIHIRLVSGKGQSLAFATNYATQEQLLTPGELSAPGSP